MDSHPQDKPRQTVDSQVWALCFLQRRNDFDFCSRGLLILDHTPTHPSGYLIKRRGRSRADCDFPAHGQAASRQHPAAAEEKGHCGGSQIWGCQGTTGTCFTSVNLSPVMILPLWRFRGITRPLPASSPSEVPQRQEGAPDTWGALTLSRCWALTKTRKWVLLS